MVSPPEPAVWQFNTFLIDRRAGVLFRLQLDGRRVHVPLGSRAFQILCLLIERDGGIIARREIMDAVWPNIAVEENNLTVQLSALRRVLDSGRPNGSAIQTIPGRGYRFVPLVTPLGAPDPERTATNEAERPSSPSETPPAVLPGIADNTETMVRATASDTPPIGRPAAAPPPRMAGRWMGLRPAAGKWRRGPHWAAACAAAVCILVLAGLWSWRAGPPHQADGIAANAAALDATVSSTLLETRPAAERPRLSLAVLPFKNLSGNPAEGYLADGVTDDLTTELSRVPGMFVIASQSAYDYQGKALDVRRIGHELGVRYVLDGSTRKLDDFLRVNTQLIDAVTGAHLWAGRFDVPVRDLNAGQEDIVRRVGQVLNVTVYDTESARSLRERPTDPDAFDLVIRARALRNGPREARRNEQALVLYEQALQLDADSVPAMMGVAGILLARNFGPVGQWAEVEDIAHAERLVARAKMLQPNAEIVLVASAELAQAQERWSNLAFEAQRLIELYPNRVEGCELLGMANRFVGSVAESVRLYERSIQLNPLESNLFHRCSCMGYALLLVGRYDESIVWFERSLAANPDASPVSRGSRYRSIAAAHVLRGRIEMGRTVMREAERLSPYATARIFFPDNPRDPEQVAQIRRLIAALRQAGLADHADEDADFEAKDEPAPRRNLAGPTPVIVPGARVIRTNALVSFLDEAAPLVIDTMMYSWERSIPGAVGLRQAGFGGSLSDTAQERLRKKMLALTHGDLAAPIVVVGWNALRFDGYNLTLRLVALGHTNVHWYRGGREAWEVAGLPETETRVELW